MPVSIDEITAEIEPPRPTVETPQAPKQSALPEAAKRMHLEMYKHIKCRAERLRAT